MFVLKLRLLQVGFVFFSSNFVILAILETHFSSFVCLICYVFLIFRLHLYTSLVSYFLGVWVCVCTRKFREYDTKTFTVATNSLPIWLRKRANLCGSVFHAPLMISEV